MESAAVTAGDDMTSLDELLAAGDRDGAYARVVAETQDSLFRFLMHLLRNEEAAREVFQETYLKVFRALDGFRGEARLTTWVLTIGRNTALNRIRSRRSREDRTDSLDDETRRPGWEPATAAEEPVATRSVTAALDRLPEAQREAVLLFYGEDLPLAEVARMTGRPANTVKSDLRRARARLRELLDDEAAGD